MPNWSWGEISVNGYKKDVEAFCELFIFSDEEGSKKKPFFARSFINSYTKEQFKEEFFKDIGDFEVISVDFDAEFAWSAHSCLVEGYPNKKDGCVTLKDACKKHNVGVSIEAEEPGMGFAESISCSPKGALSEVVTDFDGGGSEDEEEL